MRSDTDARNCVKTRWTSWASVPDNPYGLCGRRATLKKKKRVPELRIFVKEEAPGRPGLPSLIIPTVSVALKKKRKKKKKRVSELRSCVKRRGGRPGLPYVSLYGLCGRKATLKNEAIRRHGLCSLTRLDGGGCIYFTEVSSYDPNKTRKQRELF